MASVHVPVGGKHGPRVVVLVVVLLAGIMVGGIGGYVFGARSATDAVDPDVTIRMCDGSACPVITEQQLLDYALELAEDPAVVRVRHESTAQTYLRFWELFADQPGLVESIDPSILPASLKVWLTDDADITAMTRRFEGRAGVEAALAWTPMLDER